MSTRSLPWLCYNSYVKFAWPCNQFDGHPLISLGHLGWLGELHEGTFSCFDEHKLDCVADQTVRRIKLNKEVAIEISAPSRVHVLQHTDVHFRICCLSGVRNTSIRKVVYNVASGYLCLLKILLHGLLEQISLNCRAASAHQRVHFVGVVF